jgi:hypothetical protein
MPCTYTGSLEGDARLAASEALAKKTSTLTKVTQMLCATCTKAEKAGRLDLLSPKTQVWWKKHKKQDAKRKKKK